MDPSAGTLGTTDGSKTDSLGIHSECVDCSLASAALPACVRTPRDEAAVEDKPFKHGGHFGLIQHLAKSGGLQSSDINEIHDT